MPNNVDGSTPSNAESDSMPSAFSRCMFAVEVRGRESDVPVGEG